MPDIGLFEVLLIGALGFVVLGPDRIPEFFQQVVTMARAARRLFFQIKEQVAIERMLIAAPLDEAKKSVAEAADSIQASVTATDNDNANDNDNASEEASHHSS